MQNLLAHLADAWRNLIRHISLTVSSVIAVTVTLLIVGVLVVIAGNISDFTDNIESDFQIQATISPGFSEDKEIAELQAQIEQLDHVESCTFSSKEDELQELIAENGEMFRYYEGEDRNPLYDVFRIELDDNRQIDAVSEALNQMDGIVEATYGGNEITVMVSVFEALRSGRRGVCGLSRHPCAAVHPEYHPHDDPGAQHRNCHHAQRRCEQLVHPRSLHPGGNVYRDTGVDHPYRPHFLRLLCAVSGV